MKKKIIIINYYYYYLLYYLFTYFRNEILIRRHTEVLLRVILSNRQNLIHFFDIKFRCRRIRRRRQRRHHLSQHPDTAGFFY